jgi:hypothetical protein
MAIKKKNFELDKEKKIKSVRQKNVLDKHRKLIYNIASSKNIVSEDDDDLDYVYVADTKIKRR